MNYIINWLMNSILFAKPIKQATYHNICINYRIQPALLLSLWKSVVFGFLGKEREKWSDGPDIKSIALYDAILIIHKDKANILISFELTDIAKEIIGRTERNI